MSQSQEDLQKVIAIQAAIRGFLVRQDLRRQLLAIFEQEKAELEYLQENGCEYEYEGNYEQSGFNTLASEEQSESKIKGRKEELTQIKKESKEQWMQFPKVIPVLTGSQLEKNLQGIQAQGDRSHFYSSSASHLSRKKDNSQHFQDNDDEDYNKNEITNNTKQQGSSQAKNKQVQRIAEKSEREEKKSLKNMNSYQDEYGLGIHDTSEHFSEEFMHLQLANQSPEISTINDTFRFTQEGSKRPTKQDIPGGTSREIANPGTMKNLLRGTLVDIKQSGQSQYQLQKQQQVMTMGQQQQKKRSELVKVEDQRCDQDVSPSMRSSSNNSSKDIRFAKISRIGHRENNSELEPENIFFGEEDEEEEEEEEQINMMLVTSSQFKATMSAIKEMQNNQLIQQNLESKLKVKKQSAHEKNMKKIQKLVSQNKLLNEENRAKFDQLSQFSLMSYSQTAMSVQCFQDNRNESSKIYEQNEYNSCNINRYGVMNQHHQNNNNNNRWFSYDSFVIAAMDIQRVIRGYLSRKRIEFTRIKRAILKIETEYIEFKQFRVKKMKECANQLEFSAMNIIKFVKDFEKGEKYLQEQFRKKNFHKKIQLSREKLSSVFVEFLFDNTGNEKITTLNLQKEVLRLKAEIIKQQRAYQEDLLAMENKYDELKQLHKDTVSKYIEGIQKISKKKQKSNTNHIQNSIEQSKIQYKKTNPKENHNLVEQDRNPRDSSNEMRYEQLPTQDRKNSVQAMIPKGSSSPQIKQTGQVIRMTERQNGSPRNSQQYEKEQYFVERSKSPTRKREIDNYYDKNDRENQIRQDQYSGNGYCQKQKRQDNCPNSSRESMNSLNYNNSNNSPLSQSDKHQVLMRFQVEAERDLQAFEDKIKNIQRKGSSLLCMEERNYSNNNGQKKENVQRNSKKDCEFRLISHKESIK